jgi:hypothetical protein
MSAIQDITRKTREPQKSKESVMSQPPILTGQDIAEAQGAITTLLEQSLAGTGISRQEYIVLRVLVFRGPYAAEQELLGYLAGQPQVGLTAEAAAELLAGLEKRGLATGTSPGAAGPAQATPAGAALLSQVSEIVAPQTRELYASIDTADLVTAHNVLTRIITRAQEMTARP